MTSVAEYFFSHSLLRNGYRQRFCLAFVLFVLVNVLMIQSVTFAQSPAGQESASLLPRPAQITVDFSRHIAPLLLKKCHFCHGASQQLGGLRLDRRVDALKGGYSGIVIKPGDSANSKLIHLVAGLQKGPRMPMDGEALSAEEVGLLRAWIDQGAVWLEETVPNPDTKAAGEQMRTQSKHWAFSPPKVPAIPKLGRDELVRNPIDAFIRARLKKEGLRASSEADRTTLIRRLSLDLIGLPPTLEEVKEFVEDKHPKAFEHLVDRLLASPHYGEKWARQWLDLAHYADSDGYEKDDIRPYAWKWRQWVIDALNRNMPFDQFTIEQIAGDLLPSAMTEQKVATGFFRNTLTNREGGIDREEFRVEQTIDRASTVGTVWLGLTVGCARCHDHKYDPISQKEFYQLYAFFNSAVELNIEAPTPEELGPYLQRKIEYDNKRKALLAEYNVSELQADWEKRILEAAANPGLSPSYDSAWDLLGVITDGGQEIAKQDPSRRTPKERDKLTDHFVARYDDAVGPTRYAELKFKELKDKLERLKAEYPPLSEAQTIAANPRPPTTHILIRGNFRQPGIEVRPGTPAFLHSMPREGEPTRLTLAKWLVSKDNPLTARVAVNRMWQEFFGHGLVETSEDFGLRGDKPTHPELLDWLATTFMRNGWNVKQMHRLIVTSSTYRQSSKVRPELQSRDPNNKLLARQARLRLPAELIRDVTMAASGLLDPVVGGKSVRPPQPPGVVELGFGGNQSKWKESTGSERYRRGLYIQFLRTTPYPQLVNFDAPNSLVPCSRRERSTTPLQALNLLNDVVFMEAAQVLAIRILREQRGDLVDRLNYGFQLCLSRLPRPQERDRLLEYYEQQKGILDRKPELVHSLFPAQDLDGISPADAAVWVGVSRLLLNLDEFITRN
jgi:hypothetical protein